MLSHEDLLEILTYDPETGLFRWKSSRPKTKRKVGEVAGLLRPDGYICVCIDYRLYRAHRLAWFYMTKAWPKMIDHKNLIKTDNRWSNLRIATHIQNHANVGLTKRNTSGFKGVSWDGKRTKPWRAFIGEGGKPKHLGDFPTPEEAHAAYVAAAERLFGEFARTA